MKKNQDELIEQALKQSPHQSTLDKEEIWQTIENELFLNTTTLTRRKRKKKGLGIILAIAASMILIYGSLQTTTGLAIVDKIKTLFVPEKKITQNLEGTEEETDVTVHEGTSIENGVDYVIYIDEERYKMIQGDKEDVITTIEPLPENYPQVSMTILQFKDQSVDTLYNEWKAKLLLDYPEIVVDEETTDPYPGRVLQLKKTGSEWNTEVTRLYFFDNTTGGSFLIQQNYFLEASEGHGARFDNMLNEFHIVPKEE